MKTIIAPTDFSPASLNAVNYAADMACVIGTNLSMLHVCHLASVISEIPVADEAKDQITTAEAQMSSLESSIRLRVGERIKVAGKVEVGNVITEIDKYCEAFDTYAVVMGAKKTGAFERAFVGDNTISAVKKLHCPVIVVPPDVQFTRISKIGLACDYNDVIETIPTQEIRRLVKELHADLHILYISKKSQVELRQEASEGFGLLQEMIADLNPKYHFITDDKVENGIIEFADKNHLDLLIIVPKKHHGLTQIFQHSHTKRLVLHTHIPVMAIH